MRQLLIALAALVIFSCEENRESNLYDQAKSERSLKKAKLFFEQSTSDQELGKANYLLGSIYKKRSIYDSAVFHFKKSLTYFRSTSNLNHQSYAYWMLGTIYKKTNNYGVALKFYDRALALNENPASRHVLKTLKAKCHNEMSNWPEARILLHEAIEYFKEKNDEKYNLGEAYMALGVLYFNNGKLEENESSIRKALSYAQKAHAAFESEEYKAMAANNIGNAHMILGEFDMAKEYFDRALANHSQDKEVATTYFNLGKLNQHKGQYQQAIDYHKKSVALTNSLTYEFNECYQRLINLHIELGNKQEAIAVNNDFHKRQVGFIQERKELEQKANELLLGNIEFSYILQEKNKRGQQHLAYFFGIGVILLLSILFVYLRFIRNKKKLNHARLVLFKD